MLNQITDVSMPKSGNNSSSKTPFKVPSPRKKRFKKKNSELLNPLVRSASTSDVATQNAYGLLNNDQNTDDYEMSSVGSVGSRQRQNRQYRPTLSTSKVVPEKKIRPPKPVFVDCNYEVALNYINNTSINVKPKLRLKGPNTTQFFCASADDKAELIKMLKEKQLKYHTFTEPSDRNEVFILRDFIIKAELPEILENIQAEGINATNVTLFTEKFEKPVYLVHFSKGSININTLIHQYKSVGHCLVKWEKLSRTKKAPTQCHRCQTWGHTANNCGRDFRCIKCTKVHAPGRLNCDRKTREGVPKCVNCDGEHPANHQLCPAYVKYQKVTESRRTPVQRTFNSTPAPWAFNNPTRGQRGYQQEFPSLPRRQGSQRNEWGISFRNNVQHQSVSFTCQPTSSNAVPMARNVPSVASFADMQSAFMSIPEMDDTMALYGQLIHELSNCFDHGLRLSIILRYTASKPIHNVP